jgi:hypothetical protein
MGDANASGQLQTVDIQQLGVQQSQSQAVEPGLRRKPGETRKPGKPAGKPEGNQETRDSAELHHCREADSHLVRRTPRRTPEEGSRQNSVIRHCPQFSPVPSFPQFSPPSFPPSFPHRAVYLDNPPGKDFTSDIGEMEAALRRIDSRGGTAMREAIPWRESWWRICWQWTNPASRSRAMVTCVRRISGRCVLFEGGYGKPGGNQFPPSWLDLAYPQLAVPALGDILAVRRHRKAEWLGDLPRW